MFSLSRFRGAIKELQASNLKEKEFIEWCMYTYCPLVMPGVSSPSLGQVLASAHEAWRRAQAERGVAQEPLPIPEGLDDE